MVMGSGKMQQNKQRAASRAPSSAPKFGANANKQASGVAGAAGARAGIKKAGGLTSPNGKPMATAAKKAVKARLGAKVK